MLKMHYENPKGSYLHKNLLNGGTAFGKIYLYDNLKLIDKYHFKDGRCEFGEY